MARTRRRARGRRPSAALAREEDGAAAPARLPAHVWEAVLQSCPLPRLRLVKAVSREMANCARAVLRSEEWQAVAANETALAEEVRTQTDSLRLPLTVALFPQLFDDEAHCLATVHRLALGLVATEGVHEHLDARDLHVWGDYAAGTGSEQVLIRDLCVEVHGVGVCGSEFCLRQLAQELLRERGRRDADVDVVADAVLGADDGARPSECSAGTGLGPAWRGATGDGAWLPTEDLLSEMVLAPRVGSRRWMLHEAPESGAPGFDRFHMNVLHAARMGLGVVVGGRAR